MQNFNSNWQFWFFGPSLPKKVFPVEKRKSEHHHGILQIWISVGTKLKIKLIIVIFSTKFTQKIYFQWKTEKEVQGLQVFAFCVGNINSTAVFKHFEDLKISFFWTFWKKNWLSLASCPLFILKVVPAIFYQIFTFSPNDNLSKTMNNVFLFHLKSSSFSRYSNFCNFYPSFPHFSDSKGQMKVK